MMNRSALLFLSLIVSVVAFTPSSQKAVFQQARVIQGSASYKPLYMSDGKEGETSMEKTPEAPTSGTFYDDEVEPAEKIGISNSMRDRLKREASTGLDSDKAQTNVLLYIILGVAVLVVAGGQGILY